MVYKIFLLNLKLGDIIECEEYSRQISNTHISKAGIKWPQ